MWLWGRGVDLARFSPGKRCAGLRRQLAAGGEVLAGYVGRLATEKRVDLLAPVAELPGVRLVVVGEAAAALRERMPSAIFLGEQRGEQLARTYASLDVFVHSGPHETFGQTLQEAAASGVPVVAPAAGARWIWSTTESPDFLSRRGTRRRWRWRWRGWPPIPGCARSRAGPPGRRC